jgi:RNA polymerase sigma factor (TIGR02999 family)
MSDVTQILRQIESGDPAAAEHLLPLVYDELRQLAAARLTREQPGRTLQATALVHEAWLRLVGGNQDQNWESRGHFFAAAAEAMRRILIDVAREKQSLRRGGAHQRESIELAELPAPEIPADVLALNEALERFEQLDPAKAALVKLRYFAGLTIPEAAAALGVSTTTADRHWAYARAWLHAEIRKGDSMAGT